MGALRAIIQLFPIIITTTALFWTSYVIRNDLIGQCQLKRTHVSMDLSLPGTNALISLNMTDFFMDKKISRQCWAQEEQVNDSNDLWMNVTSNVSEFEPWASSISENLIGAFTGYVGDIWFWNRYLYLYLIFFYIVATAPVFLISEAERQSVEAYKMQRKEPFPSETVISYFVHTFSLFHSLIMHVELLLPFVHMEMATMYFGPYFYDYGLNVVLYQLGLIENEPMEQLLPIVVDCKFEWISTSWAMEESVGVCSIEMNSLSRWILLFFWYWLVSLVITHFALLLRLCFRISRRLYAIIEMNHRYELEHIDAETNPKPDPPISNFWGLNSDTDLTSIDDSDNRAMDIAETAFEIEINADMPDNISVDSIASDSQTIGPNDFDVSPDMTDTKELDIENDPNWYDGDNAFKFADEEEVFCTESNIVCTVCTNEGVIIGISDEENPMDSHIV